MTEAKSDFVDLVGLRPYAPRTEAKSDFVDLVGLRPDPDPSFFSFFCLLRRPDFFFANFVELPTDPFSATWWGFAPTRSLLLNLSCCLLAHLLRVVFHICDLSSVICYLRLLSDLLCVVFHICDLSSVICYLSSVIYLRVKPCCVAPSSTSKKRK